MSISNEDFTEYQYEEINLEDEKNVKERFSLFKKNLYNYFSLNKNEKSNIAPDISISLSKKYNYKQIFFIFGKFTPQIKI